MRLCTLLLIILSLQSLPGAKAMFYDPGDRGFSAAIQPREKLRPVETRGPCLHCGIHYWLETEKGEPVTETTASGMGGKFTLHIRSVPGAFEFTRDQSPAHIVIVWALSQTEVPDTAARARQRLVEMPAWMRIVRESEESTVGEIGTYVVNRRNAGVAADIVFRAR